MSELASFHFLEHFFILLRAIHLFRIDCMPVLFLVLATCMWGSNFHFAKWILPEVHFVEAAFWRYFWAVIFLFLVSLKQLPSWGMIRANLRGILSIGSFALVAFNLLFFLGMSMTSGINGALIMGLNPAVTLIISRIILKTPIHPHHLVGVGIAFVGVVILMSQGNLENLYRLQFASGDPIVLLAIVFFALHHVWVKKYSTPSFNQTPLTLMTAVATLIPLALFLPLVEVQPIAEHSLKFWVGAVSIGVIGSGISYLLWYRGIHALGAQKAGVFVNLVPLSAGVMSLFLGETLEWHHLISGLLVIGGLLVMQRFQVVRQ